MIRLNNKRYDNLHRLYLASANCFPLISAVLLNEQDGVIFVDCSESPTQIFVEHNFGFAQLFGKSVPSFEKAIEDYIFIQKSFKIQKIRLYAPNNTIFNSNSEYKSLSTLRQRFHLPSCYKPEIALYELNSIIAKKNVIAVPVSPDNISDIIVSFDQIISRFWRTKLDFANKSHAVAVYFEDKPASLCYAAASDGMNLEIDVTTLPGFRNLGLAKIAALYFINNTLLQKLVPLWDCFVNNAGSMRLCQSIGFIANKEPYPFFTVSK